MDEDTIFNKNTNLYKLCDWIDFKNLDKVDKVNWDYLSSNENAQECIEKIYFFYSLRRVVVNRKVETFLYTPQQYIY
jgi:hypothetical protein